MNGTVNGDGGERIAYHSEATIGTPYRGRGLRFSFWSKKSQKQLQKALGQRVWVITSEGRTAPRYFLVGYYTPTKMISESEFRFLEGKGKHLQQRVDITELRWFKELFKEQNNFSYGNFSRIRSASIINTLIDIAASEERRSESTSSAINQVRGDTEAAGEMFESVVSGYSSEARRFAIDLLGRVLENAKAQFRGRWTLTLHPGKVRFIAGMVMCLQFTQSGRTSAVLLKKSTPRRLWNSAATYANAPLCIEVKFDTIEELAAEYPKLREAHEAAMTICAATHSGSGGHRQAHAAGLVAYIEELPETSSDVEGGTPERWTSGFPNELDPRNRYFEGARKQVWVNAFERDAGARLACLAHYGHNCVVCQFNFEHKFGELGKEFIHVHHLKPLALTDGEYELNPIDDLRPVCPNCHAMLHRGRSVLGIDDLRALLRNT